jgi:inorganic phosphate transporter, PiT family
MMGPIILTAESSSVSLSDLFRLLSQSPLLVITIILALAVVFINGWTDAPNSVATAISTRAIAPKPAILLAAIFNFIGVMLFALFASGVAESIAGIVNFGDVIPTAATSAEQAITNSKNSLIGLSAGMVGVVAWGVLAWGFGLPSSESHALIAGLTGSCFAMMLKGFPVSPGGEAWISVGIGFFVSSIVGLVLGYVVAKLIEAVCKKMVRRKTTVFFKYAQIASACGMALAHGAQDGLKFIGVIFLTLYLGICAYPNLGLTLTNPSVAIDFLHNPSFLWLPVLVSLVMGIGTSIGGYRIIKKVGMGMVDLEPYQGFATDISAFTALIFSSALGWPVSTSQVKTCSILGVGMSKNIHRINWDIALDMVLTWVFTFPGCILIGFGMTYLLFAIPGIG